VQDPRGRVQQVAKLRTPADLRTVEPYLAEAYRYARK
jgi:hypothetical protein